MAPVPVRIVEITRDTPQFDKYFGELVQVIGQGFSTDPMTLPALGISYEVNPELRHEFDRLQLRAALTGSGRVFAAFLDTDGTERIVGAAIWYGPGKGFLDDGEHTSYWTAFMGTLSQDIQKWWQDVMLPRYDQLIKDGLGDGVKKDSLHLQILAVLPEWHQKGIGRRLVGHTLGLSEFREVHSCLETNAYLEALTDTLSVAFGTIPLDPMIPPVLGGVTYETNPEVHRAFSKVHLDAAFTGAGRVFAALIDEDGMERVAGATVWFEPGKQFLDHDDEEQMKHWRDFLHKLDPETVAWWHDVMLPRCAQLIKEGLGEGVRKGLLHLQLLGVHPEFHGKGVGKRLVKHMLEQASAMNKTHPSIFTRKANDISLGVIYMELPRALRRAKKQM